MDLTDLFIGSEGTLAVVTRVRFRALAPMPTVAVALVPCLERTRRNRSGDQAPRRLAHDAPKP